MSKGLSKNYHRKKCVLYTRITIIEKVMTRGSPFKSDPR